MRHKHLDKAYLYNSIEDRYIEIRAKLIFELDFKIIDVQVKEFAT